MCNLADWTVDHVRPDECLCWQNAPSGESDTDDCRNRGRLCFYCSRAYDEEGDKRGLSIGEYCKKVGEDADASKRHNDIRDQMVAKFKAAGKVKGLRINWWELKLAVSQITTDEVSFKETDIYRPLEH